MIESGRPFWEVKSLLEMNRAEWESLCDGCAKCCLVKLEDEDDGEVYYTDVACKQLNLDSCQCNNYAQRKALVADCICLTPDDLKSLHWLPETCAYRTLYEGRSLASWHPLISGDRNSVHLAGVSVQGGAVSELEVEPDDLEEHVIYWVK